MKPGTTKEKLMEAFYDYPSKEFHLRELARLIKVSAPAVSNALSLLEKEGLVTITKGFIFKIKAQRNNELFQQLKRADNLKRLATSGLLSYLKEHFQLAPIILFGSYARGEDTEASDIDIAIVETTAKPLQLSNFEKALKRLINIEFIKLQRLSHELRSSILNGIPLQGYISI